MMTKPLKSIIINNLDYVFIFLDCLLLSLLIMIDSHIWIRIVLGFFFFFYIPGYSLLQLLFPDPAQRGWRQAVSGSLGVSVVVTGLICLGLGYTIGISLASVWFSLLICNIAFSLAAIISRWRFHHSTYQLEDSTKSTLSMKWVSSIGKTRIALGLVLLVSIFGLIVRTSYLTPAFIEFYILGENNKATNYQQSGLSGETLTTIVGIVNHEGADAKYSVSISSGGKMLQEISPIIVADGEGWQQPVNYKLDTIGDNQKVEIELYKESQLLHSLYLWVDIK